MKRKWIILAVVAFFATVAYSARIWRLSTDFTSAEFQQNVAINAGNLTVGPDVNSDGMIAFYNGNGDYSYIWLEYTELGGIPEPVMVIEAPYDGRTVMTGYNGYLGVWRGWTDFVGKKLTFRATIGSDSCWYAYADSATKTVDWWSRGDTYLWWGSDSVAYRLRSDFLVETGADTVFHVNADSTAGTAAISAIGTFAITGSITATGYGSFEDSVLTAWGEFTDSLKVGYANVDDSLKVYGWAWVQDSVGATFGSFSDSAKVYGWMTISDSVGATYGSFSDSLKSFGFIEATTYIYSNGYVYAKDSIIVDGRIEVADSIEVMYDRKLWVGASEMGGGFASATEDVIAGNWPVLKYDASTDEDTYYSLQLDSMFKAGDSLRLNIVWAPTSNATNDTVTWAISYDVGRIGDVMTLTATVVTLDTVNGVDNGIQKTDDVYIGSTGLKRGDRIALRIFRDADASESGAHDDYASDASFIGVEVNIPESKVGK